MISKLEGPAFQILGVNCTFCNILPFLAKSLEWAVSPGHPLLTGLYSKCKYCMELSRYLVCSLLRLKVRCQVYSFHPIFAAAASAAATLFAPCENKNDGPIFIIYCSLCSSATGIAINYVLIPLITGCQEILWKRCLQPPTVP